MYFCECQRVFDSVPKLGLEHFLAGLMIVFLWWSQNCMNGIEDAFSNWIKVTIGA